MLQCIKVKKVSSKVWGCFEDTFEDIGGGEFGCCAVDGGLQQLGELEEAVAVGAFYEDVVAI